MSIIGWIIIGGLAGWIASMLVGRREGCLTNNVIGIIRVLVGGFGYAELTGVPFIAQFRLGTLVVAVIGAVVVLVVLGALTRG